MNAKPTHDAFGFRTAAALIGSSTRANGKVLMSSAEAAALLREHLRRDAAWRHAEQRRIDACLCVTFRGERWHVNAPGFHVGDLVLCLPTRRGAAIRVRALDACGPDTLAARVDLAGSLRSPARTARPGRNAMSSGSRTTADAPSRAETRPRPDAARRTQAQPAATPPGRKRNRRKGTAGAAPAPSAPAIRLVLDVRLQSVSCTPGKST